MPKISPPAKPDYDYPPPEPSPTPIIPMPAPTKPAPAPAVSPGIDIPPELEPIKPMGFTLPAGKHTSAWMIRVEVIKNMTHLVAASKSTEFHVQCQNLKVQSPTGDIQAEGQIKISAAGLDMDCERLTISWQNDWVVMEGKVRLQTEKGGQQLELIGDKLQLKLTTLTSTGALQSIKPLLYQSAYPPPAQNVSPAKEVTPSQSTPGGTKMEPFYKHVKKGG
jgi:hypothetical protein